MIKSSLVIKYSNHKTGLCQCSCTFLDWQILVCNLKNNMILVVHSMKFCNMEGG